MGSGKLLLSGVILGILAGIFFSNPLGLNIVLYVLCVLIIGVILLTSENRHVLSINSLFAIPAVFFAAMMMVETHTVLNTLNTIVMIGSLLLLAFLHGDSRFSGGSWRSLLVTVYYVMSMEWLTGPLAVMRDGTTPLLDRVNYRSDSSFLAVIRGFGLSIPVLLVAGGLFNSADLVFRHQVVSVIDWIVLPHGTNVLASVIIGVAFFWFNIALFRVMDWETVDPSESAEAQKQRKGLFRVRLGKLELSIQAISGWVGTRLRQLFHLSVIESGIILGSVVLLFVGYVITQFPYFFGGASNVTIEAYTYSSYARRGFFEAIATVTLSVGLIQALNSMTHKPSQRERHIFQGFAASLIVANGPIVISALMRLLLYESVYGLTHARLVSLMMIGCFPIIMILLLVQVFRPNERIFQAGLLVLGLMFLGILSAIRPDALIAQRNIVHYWQNGRLDSTYLLTLSDNAVPTMAAFVDELDSAAPIRALVVENLATRLEDLDHDRAERGILGYHYGKAQAWKALNQRREILANK